MSQVKQILVVDDHFEMLEFLRSMLELAEQEYQVLGVPSAEEAYLELRRMPYDLLITDLRLPGMSGFELVRQAQRWWPAMPVVIITAYYTPEGRQEAAELGVHGYFGKPPDTDALLSSVRNALERGNSGEKLTWPQEVEPAGSIMPIVSPSPPSPEVLSTEIEQCLHGLQADAGAVQVVLASLMGDVQFVTGVQQDVDVLKLARIVAAGLDKSFALAGELQSSEPFVIQYQAGRQYDLYAANVGRSHFIMLLVSAQVRRGRIGTVWVFTQRAIKQLYNLLKDLHETPAATPSPDQPVFLQNESRTGRLPETGPLTKPVVAEPDTGLPELTELHLSDPLVNMLGEMGREYESDLDAFWDEVAAAGAMNSGGNGLSFEEALKQGLIPRKWDNPDQEK